VNELRDPAGVNFIETGEPRRWRAIVVTPCSPSRRRRRTRDRSNTATRAQGVRPTATRSARIPNLQLEDDSRTKGRRNGNRCRTRGVSGDRYRAATLQLAFCVPNQTADRRAGQFDPRLAEPLIQFFATTLESKGGSEWWPTSKKLGWDAEFVRHIDSMIPDSKVPTLEQTQPWWPKIQP